eukprot:s524_g32.t3
MSCSCVLDLKSQLSLEFWRLSDPIAEQFATNAALGILGFQRFHPVPRHWGRGQLVPLHPVQLVLSRLLPSSLEFG